jgi:hypothetical protein
MDLTGIDWKRGIVAGLLAGILWGWLAMAVNTVTGVFVSEKALLINILAFSTGGAVYGVVAGGLLAATHKILPFKSLLLKAVVVSVGLWLVLRIGGAVLSGASPWRYHQELMATLQGFFLSLVMGTLLGILWKKGFN